MQRQHEEEKGIRGEGKKGRRKEAMVMVMINKRREEARDADEGGMMTRQQEKMTLSMVVMAFCGQGEEDTATGEKERKSRPKERKRIENGVHSWPLFS